MENTEVKIKVTLELDKKWASNYEGQEADLFEYLKLRLNSSLGFRGQVKKIKMVLKDPWPGTL